MLPNHLIVPECGPFLLPGGKTGCLLVHGFTAMPAEMKYLASHLHQQGYTVLSIRLAGHATHPSDLQRTLWTDWLISIEEGLSLMRGLCSQFFLIGQSLGGALTLLAASRYPLTGAIAISTPFGSRKTPLSLRLAALGKVMIKKKVASAPAPLNERCEAGYPAYPAFPGAILLQNRKCFAALLTALPLIKIPILLLHSSADQSVPVDCSRQIFALINTPSKQMQIFDGMDHSMVCDPRREEVFAAISTFIQEILALYES